MPIQLNAASVIAQQIFQGDQVIFNFTVQSLGVAFDITGYTLKMIVKQNITDTTPLLTIIGSITNGTAGQGSITMSSANTNQTPGSYVAEVKIVSGSDIRTLAQFELLILQSVSTS